MRPGRASLTAEVVGAIRALYATMPPSYGGARDDEATQLLGAAFRLPSTAVRWGLPSALMHRPLSLITAGMTQHVALRTRAIDDALLAAVQAGATQVVLLGSGLDNRPRRLAPLHDLRVFEVDIPSSLAVRTSRISRLSEKPGARVIPVPVDFERDDLAEELRTAGLHKDAPAFFIWEGVTMYLSPPAMITTLSCVARVAAPGSRIALTYARPQATPLRDKFMPVARWGLSFIGEPIPGLMSHDDLARVLDRTGFEILSDEGTVDWGPRYWNERPFPNIEWERLAVAELIQT